MPKSLKWLSEAVGANIRGFNISLDKLPYEEAVVALN